MSRDNHAYDATAAEEYWSSRLTETNELAAVLSYSLPEYLNAAYSRWEIETALRGLPRLEGLEVLDLGCGVGRLTVPLAREKAHVTSFDNSAAMLDACRRHVEEAGLGAFVTYRKGSAAALPFAASSFDVVACVGVLEHLPPDVRRSAVAETMRVLRSAGSLVLVVNNAKSHFLRREERYRMQQQQENGYFVGLMERDAIEQQISEAGFVVRPVGSNLFQGFVKHLGQAFGLLDPNSTLMSDLSAASASLDLAYPLKGDLDQAFADQWVVVAERRAPADGNLRLLTR
jgi:2-polyprenyl-3-methyl-5-hydroxy-6-metoxy-1,4-benzoquinol methylase